MSKTRKLTPGSNNQNQVTISDLPKDVVQSLQESMELSNQARQKMNNANEIFNAVQNACVAHVNSIISMKGIPKRDYTVHINNGVVVLSWK